MHDRKSIGLGAAQAMMLAGPIFVASLLTANLFVDGRPMPNGYSPGIAILPLTILVVLVGAVISFIPLAVGVVAMHALGRVNFAMRLPAIWAVVGGLVGGGWILMKDISAGDQTTAVAFCATGAVSALIVRRHAVWP